MANSDQVLTANRLRDGEAVYWRRGEWVTAFVAAEIFSGKASAEAALEAAGQAVKARIVVNPYLFAVRLDDGGTRPVEERELIRASGPSVRRDVGKQARHVSL